MRFLFGFRVLTEVTMKSNVFHDVTSCSVVESYQLLEEGTID
jgi:hypothetical protein